MANNWKNYKKKLKTEKKEAEMLVAEKKKKRNTIAICVVCAILVVAAITLAVVFVGKNDSPDISVPTEDLDYHAGTKHENEPVDVDRIIKITNDSMEPELKKGDYIRVKAVADKSELKVGDIVTFTDKNGSKVYNTARVIEIIDNGGVTSFKLKGDADSEAEPKAVSFERIVGKYIEKTVDVSELLNGSSDE